MKHTLYILIKVEVESELDLEELIDEFGEESDYDFSGTDNIKVTNLEWLDTSTQIPTA